MLISNQKREEKRREEKRREEKRREEKRREEKRREEKRREEKRREAMRCDAMRCDEMLAWWNIVSDSDMFYFDPCDKRLLLFFNRITATSAGKGEKNNSHLK